MAPRTILELPQFDTGQYDGCEFHMVGGDAILKLLLSEHPAFSMQFRRVRWHRYTQLHSCDASWINEAYFRLVEVSPTEAVAAFMKADTSSVKPYPELHHYRIFLDETGCHEVFAESVRAL
jgi:hypothetical protein